MNSLKSRWIRGCLGAVTFFLILIVAFILFVKIRNPGGIDPGFNGGVANLLEERCAHYKEEDPERAYNLGCDRLTK